MPTDLSDPQVDGLVSGFPCVSVSALNNSAPQFCDSASATGNGWRAVQGYIKRSRPGWIVLENVKRLSQRREVDKHKKPSDTIVRTMKAMGYRSMVSLINSKEFGLCQSRSRTWLIFVREDCYQELFPGHADSLCASLMAFRLRPCSLETILLGDGGSDPVQKSAPRAARCKAKELKWPKQFEAACERLDRVARL